jgi:tetratricopeptide (TPR) repeat protein
MRFPIIILSAAIVLLAGGGALADTLYLDDGSKVEGTVQRASDGYVVTQDDGTQVKVGFDHVKTIEAGRPRDSNELAMDRLASLRRTAEAQGDIHQIIALYEQFLEQNKGTPAVDEAQKDLQEWQSRLDQGLEKVSGKWMTQQEKADHLRKNAELDLRARDLLKQGRLKEADAVLQQAIADDAQNAAAQYLRGVLLLNQEEIPEARKYFEAADAALPDHPPTLNNLAIILWRQRSYVAAMNMYTQAMLAAPQDRLILDNVAEAFNALPEEFRAQPMVKHAAAIFTQEDTLLQKHAAEGGWYRWGSSWINSQQLSELKAAEAKVQDKIDQASRDFDQAKNDLREAENQIDANTRTMKQIDAKSYITDNNGNLLRTPLPPAYFDLERDNDALTAKKGSLQAKLDDLRAEAKQLELEMPKPPYTGLQQVIGLEGMPMRDMGDLAATTQATAPPDVPPQAETAPLLMGPPAPLPTTRPGN